MQSPTQKTTPASCETEADFLRVWSVYARDMHIQGVKVTMRRKGYHILCPETGREWTIRHPSWKAFEEPE